MKNEPCARLTIPPTPYTREKPSATSAITALVSAPWTRTSMAGYASAVAGYLTPGGFW